MTPTQLAALRVAIAEKRADPAAALDVIAALGKEGWEFMAMKTPEGEWMVAFSNAPQMKELIVEKVNAPTLPLAVALAAAKVWGINF